MPEDLDEDKILRNFNKVWG